MGTLDRLRETSNLTELAKLLGFTPAGASFVLYRLDESEKYRTFDIPKKSGGTRTISAPQDALSLLQKRLSKTLYECVAEIQREKKEYWRASHGFQKRKTIISNAEVHRRRRFVFNVDLEDFFGTLNFGRVRGFFIHDSSFSLEPAVATLIAQITCHNNSLPQGSPSSPVISNLIGNILDARMLSLANNTRCTYTRYADDLTFSTNEKLFPKELAVNVFDSHWEVGSKLNGEIERAGFKLNPNKTRMSLRRSRQTVTGLVVNAKANINQDYYRMVRSMCNLLFQTGEYYQSTKNDSKRTDNLNPLEGMLSHIYFVKARRDRTQKVNRLANKAREFYPPQAPVDLYRKFLVYKYFAAPAAPLIITEGVSDIVYLKCAIRSLFEQFPYLAEGKDGKFVRLVNFLKPSSTTREVLNLGQGTSGQANLISRYSNYFNKYAHKPMDYPVIVLCDNDIGSKKVFKAAVSKSGQAITTESIQSFYHLDENLYLVKIPEGDPPSEREIEDLFSPELFDVEVGGKPFDRNKDHGDETSFGKLIFAEKVVRENASKIDFSGFSALLERISKCLVHYQTTIRAVSDTQSATEA